MLVVYNVLMSTLAAMVQSYPGCSKFDRRGPDPQAMASLPPSTSSARCLLTRPTSRRVAHRSYLTPGTCPPDDPSFAGTGVASCAESSAQEETPHARVIVMGGCDESNGRCPQQCSDRVRRNGVTSCGRTSHVLQVAPPHPSQRRNESTTKPGSCWLPDRPS